MAEVQGERIAKLEEGRTALDRRIDALERDVESIKAWRSYVVGAAAAIGLFIGLFADRLRHLFMGG